MHDFSEIRIFLKEKGKMSITISSYNFLFLILIIRQRENKALTKKHADNKTTFSQVHITFLFFES